VKKRHLFWIIPLIIILISTIIFFVYTSIYYHAEEDAYEYLKSTETVKVEKKNSYYFFDSVNDNDAIIFYPGGKVETEAYAPLCMKLAEEGIDVFLMDLPLRLAMFDAKSADKVISTYNYDNYYLSGHSLGGVYAAKYASKCDKAKGVILLASYSIDKLNDNMNNILIYGSNDLVLDKEKYKENLANASNAYEYVIDGGNHSGFAYYGEQNGDGNASITKEQQIEETVNVIIEKL
jgi:predicted esterase YcpF (UPF0227 family)